jgi:hypothetical protein
LANGFDNLQQQLGHVTHDLKVAKHKLKQAQTDAKMKEDAWMLRNDEKGNDDEKVADGK